MKTRTADDVDLIEMFDAAHEAGINIDAEAISMTHGIVTIKTANGNLQRFPMLWTDEFGWLAEHKHLREAIYFARRAG